MPCRRRLRRLAALLVGLMVSGLDGMACISGLEMHGPPPPVQGPPAPSEPSPGPRTILVRELNALLGGRPPDLLRWPLVERVRQALARTDLAGDILSGGGEARIVGFRLERERGLEARRRTLEAVLFLDNAGRPLRLRALTFEFDATQGEWQLSDIRDATGNSLRRELQLSPPRSGLP